MSEVKIGIIGMGQRCCFHGGCVFVDSGARITAICDNKPDRLNYAQKMYEDKFGYQIPAFLDYMEMYEKGDMDAVFVAGPNHLHQEMTTAAFKAGLHVLCEKPMEISLAKADLMIETAKQTEKTLGLGMQMHYRRRYHRVKEIIETGGIGKVSQVWCTEYRPPYIAMKDWVWDPGKSGGAIHEKNCHHYDIMDMWVQSTPTTVYATGGIMKHTTPWGFKSDIIDYAWIVNDYDNGAKGMVCINFMATPQQGHIREFGVIGTDGKISFSTVDDETLHISYANGDKESLDIPGVVKGGLFRDFVDCLEEGRQPLVTPEMGRKSLLVPMAAEISIKEKRIVHVNELK